MENPTLTPISGNALVKSFGSTEGGVFNDLLDNISEAIGSELEWLDKPARV